MKTQLLEGREPLVRLLPEHDVDREVLEAMIAEVLHPLIEAITDMAEGWGQPVSLTQHQIAHAGVDQQGRTTIGCSVAIGGLQHRHEWPACIVLSPAEHAVAPVIEETVARPILPAREAVIQWIRYLLATIYPLAPNARESTWTAASPRVAAITLTRNDSQLHLGYRQWACALCLALRHGWEPAGAAFDGNAARKRWREEGLPPEHAEEAAAAEAELWNGNYTTNDRQIVSAADAQALAGALQRASASVPQVGKALDKSERLELPGGDDIVFFNREDYASPFGPFVGEGRNLLASIATFCARRAFAIA
jgi:hypothetical protein